MSDPIKKIELAGGKVRYRFVVDIGRDPKTGRRRQLTKTYDTKKEARAAYAKIRHQTEEGTFVAPAKMTVREWLETWLKSATIDVEKATAATTSMRFGRCSSGWVTASSRTCPRRTSTSW